MIDRAYQFQRELVEGSFSALTAEKRVLHFAAQPRAVKLVQKEIEQDKPDKRPAIQLYVPNKLPIGNQVFDVFSGLVAFISTDPDEVVDLASDFIRIVEPYYNEPKESYQASSEAIDGPGFEVVLVRFRFQQRRE